MPVIKPEQMSVINSSIKGVIEGKLSQESVLKAMNKLLPENSEPFKFDIGDSNSLSDEEKLDLLDKNISKFKQTAPDYTPPAEAFNDFKTNIESLESKSSPVNKGPKTSEPSNESAGNSGPERSSAPQKGEPDFEHEARMEQLKEEHPDQYKYVSRQSPENQKYLLDNIFKDKDREKTLESQAFRPTPDQNANNFTKERYPNGYKKAPWYNQLINAREARKREGLEYAREAEKAARREASIMAQAKLDRNTYDKINSGITEANASIARGFVDQKSNIEAYNKACSAKITGFDSMTPSERSKAAENLRSRDPGFKIIHDKVTNGYDNLSKITNNVESLAKSASEKNFDFSRDLESFKEMSRESKGNLPNPEAETPKIGESKNAFERITQAVFDFCDRIIKKLTGKSISRKPEGPSSNQPSEPSP